MPCRCDYGPEDRSNDLTKANDKITRQRKQLDELTEMLCILSKYLEAAERNDLFDSTPNLKDWWKKHKKLDEAEQERKRKKAEEQKRKREEKALAKQALAKLTFEERKALKLL